MTLTASDLYKPAVEKALKQLLHYSNPSEMKEFLVAYLNACLEAGKAKKALGYIFAPDRPDNWIADSLLNVGDLELNDFPALILRMERKP